LLKKNKQRTQYEDKTKHKDDEHTQRFYLPRGGIAPKEGKAVLKPIVNFVECQLSIFGFVDCLKERESVMEPYTSINFNCRSSAQEKSFFFLHKKITPSPP